MPRHPENYDTEWDRWPPPDLLNALRNLVNNDTDAAVERGWSLTEAETLSEARAAIQAAEEKED